MSNHHDTQDFDDSEDSNNPQLTELVAYLDGELGDAESRHLEQQLASDPPLRIYAESLDRTWQLLDSLGEATASGEFTQKTLASLQARPLDDDDQPTRKSLMQKLRSLASLPLLRIALWTTAGFVGCSIGLLFSRIQRPPQTASADTQILQQLELLQEYQKIRPIPSAEFLNEVLALDEPTAERETAP